MWHVVGSSHRAKFNRYGVGICWGWAVLGRWQGGQLPPCALLPAPPAAPSCQNNYFRCPTGVFIFFCKKQLNVLKVLV